MIYFSVIDILILFVGVIIGIIITSIAAVSGQRAHCDECIFKELERDLYEERT